MNSYSAHVIDTDKKFHDIRVQASRVQDVKRLARQAAKTRGIAVLYIEGVYGA